jgi:RNA recognition motif-containing protein
VTKLFIGNLPYDATASELKAWFRRNGYEVSAVTIEVDRVCGRSRGIALAELYYADVPDVIRSCNGQNFRGRTLIISELERTSTFTC